MTFSSLRLYTNLLLALPKHITSATDLKTLTEKRHLLNRRKKGRKKRRVEGRKGYGGVIIAESWIFSTILQLDPFLH